MGIKSLWTILGPFCERKPLYELQGKTIAIDLSCWVCEAQNISEYEIQPRMHLRNLYFRTCFLLLLGVNPVFVLEGKAPTLKYDTIAARNAKQFKGAKPRNKKDNGVRKDRSRFTFTLRQCEEMLGYMGLACIKGNGEAEAMCAYLNEDGLVEACISQDSDCFAYGAKIVYRNFSISQGAHSASGGHVDVYDIEKLIKNNSLGRCKIIALALLCGCDYCDGVFGVGKDSALKLFDKVSDNEILDRLRSWRRDTAFYNGLHKKISDKNTCTSCGHPGKIQHHNKNGCPDCHTSVRCDSSKFSEERLAIKNELGMREKAMQDPDFPNEKLISEFLKRKDKVSALNLKWKQPDLIKFVKFAVKYLQWEEIYAFEKFLPILTRWQLVNYEEVKGITPEEAEGILHPNYIKKIRNPKGIPSYEIIWIDKNECFTRLLPQDQLDGVPADKLWSTIEPQNLVRTAYPEFVASFEESKTKKKGSGKRKKKTSVADLENMLQNTSISEPKVKVKKKETKRKAKEKAMDELDSSFSQLNIERPSKMKQEVMDSYLKKALVNLGNSRNEISEQEPETTDKVPFDCDLSGFGDDESIRDLSSIIEGIIKEPPRYVNENLSSIFKHGNESSFFLTDATTIDVFEQTFNRNFDNKESDGDEESRIPGSNNSDSSDSFSEEYVPLMDRILKSKN